jgi:hypothetical protein
VALPGLKECPLEGQYFSINQDMLELQEPQGPQGLALKEWIN